MAAYDLTKTKPGKIQTGDILNCPYSGAAYRSPCRAAGTGWNAGARRADTAAAAPMEARAGFPPAN